MSVVWRRTLRCSFQSVLLDGKTATGEHCLIFCCLNPDARSWGFFVTVLTASHAREASPASASREPPGLGRGTRPPEDPSALRSAAAACPHALARGNVPNLARKDLGEPEVAIGSGRDELGSANLRLDAELADGPTGRDAPDLVPITLGKPQVAIRPGGDDARLAPRHGELGDGACCSPGGETAQAEPADRDSDGGEQCGQARPQTRTLHGSCSFVGDAPHGCHVNVSSSLQRGSA